ncbi:unnamed protein product [Lepeophtheirus salmonis]|uniref:(salmon louse) hypothetical protein n=1 Tax=Lepeophtheirus salmonis TaxID=72036 RepID=A0A7R8CK89_LEPSM|nr:unnamed protein product [Lepeophtheirus salmonis]CAF2843453.1 unnamed protein product [Lepeophtheirus salmonis]
MEVESNTEKIPLDIHKAIRLKNLVKSGNFHIRAQNNNKNTSKKNLVKSEDLKDSLEPGNLIKKSNYLRDSALNSQHKFVWLKNFHEINLEIESLSLHSNLIPVELLLEGKQSNEDVNRLIENIVLRNGELSEKVLKNLAYFRMKEHALMSQNFISPPQKPHSIIPDLVDQDKDEIFYSNDVSLMEDYSSCSDLTTIPEVSIEEDKSPRNQNIESSEMVDSGIDSKTESNYPMQVPKIKDSDENEAQSFLDKILLDVYHFYEKKLNVLKLKISIHSQVKPGQRELEDILHQKKVSRWILLNEQMKTNYDACLEDLRRESQKISDVIRKTEASRKSKKNDKTIFLLKLREQKELCTQLKDTLVQLKEVRMERMVKEERIKGLEMKKQWKIECLKMERKKQYQEEQKTKIFEHKEAKKAVILERKSILEKEVGILLQKKREQDKEKEKEMDTLEREARLQALRKVSRRRTEKLIKRIKAQRGIEQEKEALKDIFSRTTVASEERFKKELMSLCSITFPFKTLNTYTSDDILKDSRVVVESIFRDEGLITNNYARQQILSIPPPTKPRPETQSQIKLYTYREE